MLPTFFFFSVILKVFKNAHIVVMGYNMFAVSAETLFRGSTRRFVNYLTGLEIKLKLQPRGLSNVE